MTLIASFKSFSLLFFSAVLPLVLWLVWSIILMDESLFGVMAKETEREWKSECENSKEPKSLEHVLFDTQGHAASPTGVFESVAGCVLAPDLKISDHQTHIFFFLSQPFSFFAGSLHRFLHSTPSACFIYIFHSKTFDFKGSICDVQPRFKSY